MWDPLPVPSVTLTPCETMSRTRGSSSSSSPMSLLLKQTNCHSQDELAPQSSVHRLLPSSPKGTNASYFALGLSWWPKFSCKPYHPTALTLSSRRSIWWKVIWGWIGSNSKRKWRTPSATQVALCIEIPDSTLSEYATTSWNVRKSASQPLSLPMTTSAT